MSSIARYAVVLALSLGCVGLTSSVHCQTQPKKVSPNSVSGRITIHGKGAAGIVVGIRSAEFSPQSAPALKATTDQDGNYRITDVPPGNYQVSPLAPAFVNPELVASRARGKTLLLGAGEEVQGIDFSLIRGGVIAGKVTDSEGRPVIEERLTIIPEDQTNARAQMFSSVGAGASQTDDRGIYRIYGIPAGRYKISVGLADDGSPANFRFGRVAYKRTFYPAAIEAGEAEVIEISEGTEVTNIDITVGRSLPGFVVTGKIVDGETGQPVVSQRIGLRRTVNGREEGGNIGAFSLSNNQGEFRLENVTPGKYTTFTLSQPGSEVRADSVPFEVVDQDLAGLLVKTIKGLTVTGTVALEGTADRSAFAKLAALRLQVYVRGEGGSSPSWQQSAIGADGSFRLGGLGSGTATFSLTAEDRRPPPGFAILRVEHYGVVQPRGVEIKPGEQTTGVKILVTYGTGSVRGEVRLENGPLPPNGRLLAWIKKLGETGTTSRAQTLDARGYFLIEGVAAGSYELNVNANIPGSRPPPSAKQSLEVSDGTVTEVVITLDLKSNQGQPPRP